MKSILKMFSFFLLSLTFALAQEKSFPRPHIEFSPKNYVCYRAEKEIVVDGKLDEEWKKAIWTDYFVDIEGTAKPNPRYKTRAKMLWDDKYLYVAAELEEPNLWATLKQRDTIIFYDNDFEVFIDPDGDTHNYYELEINALGTAWDLLLTKPYRDATKQIAYNSWNYNGLKVATKVYGTLNNPNDVDSGWTCEIALPWSSLRESFSNESTPKAGEQWRINFSRVQWKLKTVNGKYEKEINPQTGKPYPEDNWVWSPQGIVNMHYPEMWGFLQLSNKIVGSEIEEFEMKEIEQVKWALRNIYYAEKTFHLNNNIYTSNLEKLLISPFEFSNYNWPPKIEAATNTFEAVIFSKVGSEFVSIKDDGEVIIRKK